MAPLALSICVDMAAQRPGVCGKSPEEIEEKVEEVSLVAGSGSDTLLYMCNHLCELQRQ